MFRKQRVRAPHQRAAVMTPAEQLALGRKIFPQYTDSRRVFELRALSEWQID